MYIYQDGKLYTQLDDKNIVGVEIHPLNGVSRVVGTEATIGDVYQVLTKAEAIIRFQIDANNPYIFPREVKDNDTVEQVPRRVGRPRSK